MSDDQFDIAIFGAGISGLTLANISSAKQQKVCVVDQYDHIGGNHISINLNDYSFDIGSFLFWSDNPQFIEYPELLDVCPEIPLRIQRITPQGTIREYPYELKEMLDGGPGYIFKALLGIAAGKIRHAFQKNVHDYTGYYIGEFLKRESGIDNYIRRFYPIDQRELSIEFARSRMGWIRSNGSLRRFAASAPRRLLALASKKSASSSTALVRPVAGFGAYYGPIRDRLEAQGVQFRLGSPLRAIRKTADGFEISADPDTIKARRIYNTMPIPLISELAGLGPTPGLGTSTLITLCCSFSGPRAAPGCILYNFDTRGVWKRLTLHSDFYGERNGRGYMSVECVRPAAPMTAAELFEDFRSHVLERGVFTGDIRLEHVFELTSAYPIHDMNASSARDVAIRKLEAFGIGTIGRQGSFDYIPHSTIAIDKATAWLKTQPH